ncbi:hypothetical protein ILYODFUR_020907 [Ilyodon furcidens]|uniref:Uncharacterized protein n=1 Tax=Ilyodon furcidens TaxID=33524 RepID=A0ABV0T9Z9_9TELE
MDSCRRTLLWKPAGKHVRFGLIQPICAPLSQFWFLCLDQLGRKWQRGLTSVTWSPAEVMTVGVRMQMCTFVSWNSNPKGSVNPNSIYIPQGLQQHISLIRDKSTQ